MQAGSIGSRPASRIGLDCLKSDNARSTGTIHHLGFRLKTTVEAISGENGQDNVGKVISGQESLTKPRIMVIPSHSCAEEV